MQYPKYAKVDGVKYPINTSFKVALRCFEVADDETISDTERTLAIVYLLYGFIPENNLDKFLQIAVNYLQCGETKEIQSSKKRDMDLNYDLPYIMASFMSDYKIDITESDMHFYQFINLIRGLTENTVLSRVREIRNQDLNELKDPKTKRKFLEAQEQLKLPVKISIDDQEALDEFELLFRDGVTNDG